MVEYTVLWLPQPQRPPPAPRANRLGSMAVDEQRKARITHENWDAKQAGEAAQSPDLRLAKKMPTRLIAPLAATSNATGDSWGLEAVGADKSLFDGAGCRLAMLDTGIDEAHSAFDGISIDACDFTGEGHGDANGHGTHCAGTIFGRTVNGQRIGVAPGVTHAFVGKVLDGAGKGTTPMIYDGLMWAINKQVDVISMSIGFDFPGQVAELVADGWPAELATSEALEAYCAHLKLFELIMARTRQPILGNMPLIIAACGNESRRDIRSDYRIATSLPAAVCDIAVGAVRRDNLGFRVADFSNARPLVVAPGVDIVSAASGGGLLTLSGTSMACPHVAGVAALWAGKLRKEGEQVTASSLRSYIEANTRRDLIVNFDKEGSIDVGRGLVSAPH